MAFNQNITVPEVSWMDEQQFTTNETYPHMAGIPIPVHERMLTGEIIPRSMSAPEVEQAMHDQALQEAEIQKAEELAKAGKDYWDAVLAGAIEFLGGGGMLKADEQNKQSDDKLIALAQQQADAITSLANAQTSTDVAKDLEEETTKKDSGGRRTPVKIENLRGEKPGYSMAEGSNYWSVNEKDSYWQTKEGHKEAMNLYGTKPGWVKEPSLEYNPKTGKYDPIEKEEFAEIKPKKRISL